MSTLEGHMTGRLPAGNVGRVGRVHVGADQLAAAAAAAPNGHPGSPGKDVRRTGGVLTHGGFGNARKRPAAALDPVQEGVDEDAATASAVELEVIVPLRWRYAGRGHDHGHNPGLQFLGEGKEEIGDGDAHHVVNSEDSVRHCC
eukprot:CAMPEP_0178704634 /NCGR_PEP_ID=MMETSP0699-20121125/14311_1 /TAXON_ID=265572 /ORGANISM="Extubocellulus spinifer, Strain CCMP396" /LENGTH=143 /DNA_ID=CAMNT_0020352047 /DNA_START=345 /DNA_END=776 /DNA_ORIENTATION=-